MIPLYEIELQGLRFECREGSSDEKTFLEVVEKGSYERKYFPIGKNKWLDLGGNVGAFTVLAASRGAQVTVVEPDPQNAYRIKRNLMLNNLSAKVIEAAVVHDDRKEAVLNLWPDGQSWRNSIVRNKKGTRPIKVPCLKFSELAQGFDCVKMDIEGSEIPLLLNYPDALKLKQLVFEWSFDADPYVDTLRRVLGKLSKQFTNLKFSSQVKTVQKWSFFPPCTLVHAWNSSDS